MIKLSRLIVALSCLLSINAFALDDLRISGFMTLGTLYNDSNTLGFKRDLSRHSGVFNEDTNFSTLSVFGLQANGKINSQWSTIFQAQFEDNSTFDSQALVRMAALSYEPTPTIMARFGRIKPRMYMNSASKDISYSSLTTIPNVEFYGAVPLAYIDGLDVTHTLKVGNSFIRTNAFYGDQNIALAYPYTQELVEFDFKGFKGLNFEFEYGDLLIRLGITETEQASNWFNVPDFQAQLIALDPFLPGLAQIATQIDPSGKTIEFTSFGVDYQSGAFHLVAEFGRLDAQAQLIPSSEVHYINLGYSLGDFTPYIIFSGIQNYEENDIDISGLPLGNLPAFLPSNTTAELVQLNPSYDQTNMSLGMRWDFRANTAFKLQWDMKKVDVQGSNLWSIENAGLTADEKVNVISATIDWVF